MCERVNETCYIHGTHKTLAYMFDVKPFKLLIMSFKLTVFETSTQNFALKLHK